MRNIVRDVLQRVLVRERAMRLFLAIPLPVEWQKPLTNIEVSLLHQQFTGMIPTHWTPTENLHITVRFIGSVDKSCIPHLRTTIKKLTSEISQFTLPFESIEVATHDDPKMIWTTFTNVDEFRELVTLATSRIETFLADECHGMKMHNGHDVLPHVTLARVKGHLTTQPISADGIPKSLPVTELILYESKTSPVGSVYRNVATFPLTQ